MSSGGFDSVSPGVGAGVGNAGVDAAELSVTHDVTAFGWVGVAVAATALYPVSSAISLATTKPTPLSAPNLIASARTWYVFDATSGTVSCWSAGS
jgi:hypothetical protein